MATIEFVQLISNTRYCILVNDKRIKINNWKGGFNLLKQYINDCEQALLAKDAEKIHVLLKDYNLRTQSILRTLSNVVF